MFQLKIGHRAAMLLALGMFMLSGFIVPKPAAAQGVTISVEFRTALNPYGRFHKHARWGEVWIPKVARDWRPYTVGRWVYNDDYGWYWVSAESEASWGWVAFHYGRWVYDDDLGWCWVSGRQWGPAWVSWRRGTDHVAWAPLPPDEILVEVFDTPRYWAFVRPRDLLARRISTVIVPFQPVYLERTVIVNRTIIVRERDFAVNPGIAPAIIAARIGRPIEAYDVRPRVLAGTVRLRNAVEIRPEQLRSEQSRREIGRQDIVREAREKIEPARDVPEPRPLAKDEQGRLGDRPPRAAREAAATPDQADREQRGRTGKTPPAKGEGEQTQDRGRGNGDQQQRAQDKRHEADQKRRDQQQSAQEKRDEADKQRTEKQQRAQENRKQREEQSAPQRERLGPATRSERRQDAEPRKEPAERAAPSRGPDRGDASPGRSQPAERAGPAPRGPPAERVAPQLRGERGDAGQRGGGPERTAPPPPPRDGGGQGKGPDERRGPPNQ
jgi:hypothetical protein